MVLVAARRLAGKAQVPGLKVKHRKLPFSDGNRRDPTDAPLAAPIAQPHTASAVCA
jgi:hypothetical protein